MGGKATKSRGPSHWELLPAEQQEMLKTSFAVISQGRSECAADDLKAAWSGLVEEELLQQLLRSLSTGRAKKSSGDGNDVDFSDYAEFAGVVLKGTTDEQVDAIWTLAAASQDGIHTEELMKYVRSLVESYLRCQSSRAAYASWKPDHCQPSAASRENLSLHLLHELIFKGKAAKETLFSEKEFSQFGRDEVARWLERCPVASVMQGSLVACMYGLPSPHDDLVPLARGLSSDPFPSVLNFPGILFLNSGLPLELRKEWRFLFSTKIHGESFSKLLGHVTNRGPTILVVVDKNHHVFGGFAPCSWSLGPKFVGSSHSFLFNLSPKMALYGSTGYNSHYMYLNVQQQTLPNGLGMGGQLEYFGLWLDAEFGQGRCSPTCTTFQSPQLSARPEFQVEHLEVWGVGPEPKDEEGERDRPSVLDADLEARAMLEMMGKERVGLEEDRPERKEEG